MCFRVTIRLLSLLVIELIDGIECLNTFRVCYNSYTIHCSIRYISSTHVEASGITLLITMSLFVIAGSCAIQTTSQSRAEWNYVICLCCIPIFTSFLCEKGCHWAFDDLSVSALGRASTPVWAAWNGLLRYNGPWIRVLTTKLAAYKLVENVRLILCRRKFVFGAGNRSLVLSWDGWLLDWLVLRTVKL